MKDLSKKKKIGLLLAGLLCIACCVVGILFYLEKNDTPSEPVMVMQGKTDSRDGGLTLNGTVSIGTITQNMDLDIREYSSSDSNRDNKSGGFADSGGPGGFGQFQFQSGNQDKRSLEIESVFVKVGQQIHKGDVLLKLKDESMAKIRKELTVDADNAKVQYEKIHTEQQKQAKEARQVYDASIIYGNAAQLEYDERMYELEKARDDAEEAYEDAIEKLTDLQEELDRNTADLPEAKHYLAEAEAAVTVDQETYWYLQNEELRQQALERVESEEDRIEELTDEIRDLNLQITELKVAWDNANMAYQTGENEAKLCLEQRKLQMGKAAEIYSLATDKLEYNERVAKEDYEEAEDKLTSFETYLENGLVLSDYDGVITSMQVKANDRIKSDGEILVLNSFEDVTLKVNVEDEDMKSIERADRVTIRFTSYPDQEFTGIVSDIGDATIDSTTSSVSYEVSIDIDGDVTGLYEGMTGAVTFPKKNRADDAGTGENVEGERRKACGYEKVYT